MKNKESENKQRGSALLLTLGILSLVLILAMSFAFTARTTRQVAKVNADQIKARLLAESALERVLAAMKHAYDEEDPITHKREPYPPEVTGATAMKFSRYNDQGYIFSSDGETPTTEEKKDFQELIPYASNDRNKIYFLPSLANLPSNPSSAPTFQKIGIDLNDNDDIDDPGEIIGRIGFLILEEANKLDVNQMLSLNEKVPFVISGAERLAPFSVDYSAADFLYKILGNDDTTLPAGTNNDYEGNTVRLGLNMQELQLAHEYFTLLVPGFPGTKAQWFSYTHLWKTKWESASDADKYTFFSGEDVEAYWDETDEVERQRFDVTGYEWGGWGEADTLAKKQRLVTELIGADKRSEFSGGIPEPDYSQDSTAPATAGFGIPHLRDLEDTTTNHGKQIAANMVDFCDDDSIATTEIGWETKTNALAQNDAPSYFGNEKVPYINEFALSFIANNPTKDISDPTSPRVYSLKFRSYFELANIFAEEIPPTSCSPLQYTIQLSMSVACDNSGVPVSIPSINFSNLEIVSNIPAFSTEYNFALSSERDIINSFEHSSETLSFTIALNKIVIVIHDSNDNVYDLSYLIPNGDTVTVRIEDISYGDTLSTATWEVYDPRFNHPADQWKMSDWQEEPLENVASVTLDVNDNITEGMINPISMPEAAYDCDLESYPCTSYSTAFIPNRPFRSLWELGAIHRGEPFRTINLTAFSAAGGSYADGDAAILDQVKIGPLKKTRGKFNANSSNPAAFVELLRGINITDKYGSACSYSTPGYNAPTTLDKTASTNRGVFASRIPTSGLYVPEPANDREREALIGRTANLLTTRMDKYTVLVVGQALKLIDLPSEHTVNEGDDVWKTLVNPVQLTESGTTSWYSILATQRILAHIVRDAWKNEYKIVQMQLLED
jgi:hypothetical protein